jgi:signal transduction histidine kinase
MESTIRRTAAEEYRKYMLLLDSGKSITGTSEEDLETQLGSLTRIFGPDGNLPGLVSSFGYFTAQNPSEGSEYIFKSESWTEIKGVFSQKSMNRSWEFFPVGDENTPSSIYLAVDSGTPDVYIFFMIDQASFTETYVKPVIAETNEGYLLEWIEIEDSETKRFFEKSERIDPEEYRFKPFASLTRTDKRIIPMIIEMPGFFEARRYFDERTTSYSSSSDEGNAPDIGMKSERPAFLSSDYYVKINHESGSIYYKIEYDASVSFFETVFILFIIGTLFVLLLFQLQRTRSLRQKEKEFVASITHELRTPLTVIKSAADNISTGIVSAEKLPVYSGLISNQVDRLSKMIEEILLFSRFEGKKQKPENPILTDFGSLEAKLKPALNVVASPNGVEIIWDAAGLPRNCYSYPEVISIVVDNLVTNAVNHAYKDIAGAVRVRFHHLIPDKIQVTVEDDGRGIEPRELKYVFEPFYRDEVSRRKQEKGSGLGLFISKRKAVLCAGCLEVESPYRRIDGSRADGCRFTLTLPCRMEQNND